MTTPLPPTDPLHDDELELARVLRALPGGEPSAALDAKILRASQDALAQQSPRRRLLWAGGSSGALWGIGSAAAAILAVGIGWRLTTPPDSLPVPRALPTVVDSASDQEAMPVEFKPQDQARRDDAPAAAPPHPPPELKQELPRRGVALPPPAPAAAPASPEPFPQPEEYRSAAPTASAVTEADAVGELDTTLAPPAAAASGAAAREARDAREAYSERQRDEVLGRAAEVAKAAPASAPAPATAETSVGGREMNSVVVTGDPVPRRVAADANLAATDWLERIRARAKDGDTDGARASLRLFVQRHPDRTIPADLRPLLGE